MQSNMDIQNLLVVFGKLKRIQNTKITELLNEYEMTLFHAQYLLVFNQLDKAYTLSEITDLVNTNKSSTTRAIKDLINKGFVKKTNVSIKRGYNLVLTDKGREVYQKVSKSLLDYHLQMISALDDEREQKQLIYLLDKLLNKLNETNFQVLDDIKEWMALPFFFIYIS